MYIYKLDSTPSKRSRPKKVAVSLDDRYPTLNVSDDVSEEEERSAYTALMKEMRNAKPRKDVFLPLMKKTFGMRRHYILHTAASVQHIIRDYPGLKEANGVSKI